MGGWRDGFKESCPIPADKERILDGADRTDPALEQMTNLLGALPGDRIIVVAINEDGILGAIGAANTLGRQTDLFYGGQGTDPSIWKDVACNPNYIAIGGVLPGALRDPAHPEHDQGARGRGPSPRASSPSTRSSTRTTSGASTPKRRPVDARLAGFEIAGHDLRPPGARHPQVLRRRRGPPWRGPRRRRRLCARPARGERRRQVAPSSRSSPATTPPDDGEIVIDEAALPVADPDRRRATWASRSSSRSSRTLRR